jgi:replicative superfamily II helicase
VNTAIFNGRIDELGMVVLDEMHMIDEANRGYIMELMITIFNSAAADTACGNECHAFGSA